MPIASAVAGSLSLSLEKLKVGYLNPVNVNAYGDGTAFDSNIQLELDDVLSSTYVSNVTYQNPGRVNFNIMPGLGVGQHKVTISGPTQDPVNAYFEVVTPSFTLSTSLVQLGYSTPVEVVANAVYTTFVNGNTTAKLFLGESEVTNGLTGSSVTSSTYNFTVATGLSAGTYTVKITTTGTETGTEVLTKPFTVYAASISTISPDNVHVGYTSPKEITLTGTGTNFSGSTKVYVKNNSTLVEAESSSVIVTNTTQLRFNLPADLAAGAYTVRVVTGSEQVTKAFTVRNPSVSSISPASIPDSWIANSAVPITVYGVNTKFTGVTSASLWKNSTKIRDLNTIVADSDTQLRANIPVGTVSAEVYTLKLFIGSDEEVSSTITFYHPSISISPNQRSSNYSSFTMTMTGTNTNFNGTSTVSVVYQGAAQPNTVSNLSVSGLGSLSFTLASGLSYTGTYSIKVVTGNETAEAPFTVTQSQSNDANLTSLGLSNGTLSPSFSASTTNYTASVVYSVSSITLTPTLSNSGASVAVNSVSATNGQASNPISLNLGANIIPVVVTAEDSSTKTYQVTVNRATASTNNTLSNLSVNQGTLTPSFASGTTSYTINVANNITNISVTPTTTDTTATVKVNGSDAASGVAYGPINLNVGLNSIPVVVTAENGTTNTYTITVNRAQSSNNNLSNLVVGTGTISPVFVPNTTSYTVTLPYTTTQFSLTPTKADTTASITVNGTAAVSGAVYGPYAINVGANTFTIVVTAEDSSTKTYTLTVNRTAISSDNNLASIALSAGTLSPAFAQGTTSYTVDAANSVTNFSITPTTANTFATMTVNGTAAVSGAVYGPTAINVGANTFTIVVTSQDGTPKTYTITVNRAQSANNNLSSLAVSTGSLSPAFEASTNSYTVSVANTETNFSFTPTVADSTASITVNGYAAVSGAVYGPTAINVGANPFTIVVTAQNGSQNTYTVTVTRAASGGQSTTNPTTPSTGQEDLSGSTNTTTKTQNGQTTATVTINETAALDSLNKAASVNTVVIPVTQAADIVNAQLTSSFITALLSKNTEVTVEIKASTGSYTLPAAEVKVAELAQQLGAAAADVKISIVIAKPSQQEITAAAKYAKENGLTEVVVPVEFKVEATAGDKTVAISSFGSYVSRSIKLPKAVNANAAIGVMLNPDGSLSPVPTQFKTENGQTVAVIKRKGNSTYTVVEYNKTFADVASHWAKDDVNTLASKLIINGMTETAYAPDNKITRAQLATLIVRSLGLQPNAAKANFKDVMASDWYTGAIGAAAEAGIINGYTDGTFKPNTNVSREEIAAMVVRALKFAGADTTITSAETEQNLAKFADRASVASWAKTVVAVAVKNGIIKGYDTGKFIPANNSSRAESAAMIKRMLVKANFI